MRERVNKSINLLTIWEYRGMLMKKVLLKKITLSNGETLGYREREGGSVPLLLIHGNMTSSKHFDTFLEEADEKYKIYALDLRGFGESTYNTRVEDIRDFAEDVKLFVDKIHLKDFALLGWSLGGGVCLQYAALYPDDCHHLILISSVSTRGYPLYEMDELGRPNVNHRLSTREEVERDGRIAPMVTAYETKNYPFLRAVWDSLVYVYEKPEEERYQSYLEDMTTQRNLADVYYSLNSFNLSNDHNGLKKGSNEVQKIHIPVLILYGDKDYVITQKMTREITVDLGEFGTYVELNKCGHSPLVDALDQVLHEMNHFLNEKEG